MSGNSRIRTYGRFPYDGLASRCLKPLSHISMRAPYQIRTDDPRFTRAMLWPTELRGQNLPRALFDAPLLVALRAVATLKTNPVAVAGIPSSSHFGHNKDFTRRAPNINAPRKETKRAKSNFSTLNLYRKQKPPPKRGLSCRVVPYFLPHLQVVQPHITAPSSSKRSH